MPWFQQWTSDNGRWSIFSFTTKFARMNGVLTAVGEAVYIPTNPNYYDNPEHRTNAHVPVGLNSMKKIPKYVRERAEALYNELNAYFVTSSYAIVKEVVYDQQRLHIGDKVTRIEEWKKAPEGHYIARFKVDNHDDIPLMMDEVDPILNMDRRDYKV